MVEQDEKTLRQLDEITRLLEDFLILELLKMKAKSQDVRALLKVNITRVNKISRMIKKGKLNQSSSDSS